MPSHIKRLCQGMSLDLEKVHEECKSTFSQLTLRDSVSVRAAKLDQSTAKPRFVCPEVCLVSQSSSLTPVTYVYMAWYYEAITVTEL